jgi:hypothetical protein
MVQTSLPVRNDSTHIQTYHERMWQLTMVSVPKQESSGSHRCRTEARAQQLKAPSASACPRQYFGNQKTPTILCFLPVDLSYFQAAKRHVPPPASRAERGISHGRSQQCLLYFGATTRTIEDGHQL